MQLCIYSHNYIHHPRTDFIMIERWIMRSRFIKKIYMCMIFSSHQYIIACNRNENGTLGPYGLYASSSLDYL